MPRLKRLTSRQALGILGRFGFDIVSTRGNHAKLVRTTDAGGRQVVTVPLHRELPTGTVRAIYRQASRFVPVADLQAEFFSDRPGQAPAPQALHGVP